MSHPLALNSLKLLVLILIASIAYLVEYMGKKVCESIVLVNFFLFELTID